MRAVPAAPAQVPWQRHQCERDGHRRFLNRQILPDSSRRDIVSGEDLTHDLSAHIGQAEITSRVVVGQGFVVESHEGEKRGMQIH